MALEKGREVKERIFLVLVFGMAFAFVEASVVVYLRHLLGASLAEVGKNEILLLLPGIAFLEPQTALKIITDTGILEVEKLREAATIVMLAAVGFMAGRKIWERLAFFLLAFGVWDLFYYVFLKLTIGWPKTLADMDTFFLLPTPWVGPVLVPVTASSLIIGGSLVYLLRKP